MGLDREETRWLGKMGASAGVSGGWTEAPSQFLALSQGDKLSPGASDIFHTHPQRGGMSARQADITRIRSGITRVTAATREPVPELWLALSNVEIILFGHRPKHA